MPPMITPGTTTQDMIIRGTTTVAAATDRANRRYFSLSMAI